MSASLLVIPLFVAHQGCPHRCIFCDQFAITATGAEEPPLSPEQVHQEIEEWLARPRKYPEGKVQVAFYGGSFTAMDRGYQRELLQAVQPYIADGRVESIRLSTRPDSVGDEALELLRNHGVKIVELGAQSLQDEVLVASKRGHTAADVALAVSGLRRAGMTVGLQLMIGLPGDTTKGFIDTVKKTVSLAPDFVRIYPAVVMEQSGLAALFSSGKYVPLSLNKAVALAARARAIFGHHRIPVVRMGLQPSLELEDKKVAGPYHPAFGELVLSRLFFKAARRFFVIAGPGPHVLAVAPEDESAFRGQGNANIKRLIQLGLLADRQVQKAANQPRYTVALAENATVTTNIFSDGGKE